MGLDENVLETLLGQVRRTDSLIMARLNERRDGFERWLTYQAVDASRWIARRGDRSSPRAFPTFRGVPDRMREHDAPEAV